MNDSAPTQIKDTSANPAPLGLLGFGMTTVLLNLHNAGMYELNSMILAMGLCYGGAAQILAGLMEWKKGNTFSTTAFVSYGFFWLSLVALLLLPKVVPNVTATTEPALGYYLAAWGVFTAVMLVGTFRLSRALQFVFGSLTLLFFLLAYEKFNETGAAFKHATGWEGVVCGGSAMYTGLAQILNELHGKTILPLGLVKK